MAGSGGLAEVLFGAMIGLCCALVGIGLGVFGLVTRRPRGGFIASMIAVGLAILAVRLSVPIWMVLLEGRDTHGDPLNYGEMGPAVFLAAVEAIALVITVPGALRQALRRMA